MIREGAGAAIISEEAFFGNSIGELLQVLREQPSWSDFPLILLTVSGRVTVESERLREMRRPLGNLFLLERPLRPETLLSTLEIALRGRERQYQIRDQMQQYALAQEALLRSEKLAVTGRLAASIAHEINNPLEAVTNLLFLMRAEASPEQRKKYLAQAEHELARVAEITKQTLRFYREPSQPTATKIVSVLDSVLMLFGQRAGQRGNPGKTGRTRAIGHRPFQPGGTSAGNRELGRQRHRCHADRGPFENSHLSVPKSAAKPEAGSPDHRRFRHGDSARCAAHDL